MSFQIIIQPGGHACEVEDNETILAGALHHGFAFPYGCRNGSCGSCIGKVVSGQIDYRGFRPSILSTEDKAAGQAIFCQAYAASDLEIEVQEVGSAQGIRVKTLPARVIGIEDLAPDVKRLRLKLPATERLRFLPGQYVDILLKDGKRRGFSIANVPHDDEPLELHIRHVPGGKFTDFVFTKLKEKALLRFQGPLGAFVLREDSSHPIIMVAGGTGFAPIKAMIQHAIEVSMQRDIHLFWGARARRDLYLDGLARSWAVSHENIRYTPVLSEPVPSDNWEGETGLVHLAVLRRYPDLSPFEVYASGPPALIEAVRKDFLAAALPADRLYFDSFEYAVDTLAELEKPPKPPQESNGVEETGSPG